MWFLLQSKIFAEKKNINFEEIDVDFDYKKKLK